MNIKNLCQDARCNDKDFFCMLLVFLYYSFIHWLMSVKFLSVLVCLSLAVLLPYINLYISYCLLVLRGSILVTLLQKQTKVMEIFHSEWFHFQDQMCSKNSFVGTAYARHLQPRMIFLTPSVELKN